MSADVRQRFALEWSRLERRGVFAELASAQLAEAALCLEREAFASDDLGIFLSVIATYGLGQPILARDARALPADAIVAVAITEPGAGSDARALQCSLRGTGVEGFMLNGHKWCITNAPVCTHVIVFCRHAETRRLCAVLLERARPGIEAGPPLETIGARASPTGTLTFAGVRVERADLLGEIGDGELLLTLAFERERLLAAWPLLGMAARILQRSLAFALEREQFGRAIASQPLVQARLVAAYEDYLTTRALAEDTLRLHAAGASVELRASMLKARAADMAERVVREAIAVHGSRGVLESARLGEYLHDSVCASIAGGTKEIHARVVFDALHLDILRMRRGHASTCFPPPPAEAP